VIVIEDEPQTKLDKTLKSKNDGTGIQSQQRENLTSKDIAKGIFRQPDAANPIKINIASITESGVVTISSNQDI
jgi:hypothetical protein